MQAEHLSDELLQRHYDGDLDRAETAQVEAHLAGCAPCRTKHAGLAKLGELVTLGVAASAAGASFDGMFERIERGIAAESARRDANGKVVPLASKRKNFGAAYAIAGTFAAAAAVLLMVYRPDGNTLPDDALPNGSATTATAPAPAQTAAVAPAHSEVVQVDFGSNAGTVFDISLSDGSSTPVIWINDDE